ncbi:SDR family NAD(P)-dependent oxidoreductase [Phenylobacterium sp.]|uniref:SDR family NAD(P)-dependent oxidoreductase n=1 Tax=Phenylobacterium sp. TaxID=1871053 RepID=UPI002CB3FD26|nr:SDR family NAD(P)-dependent oxidoreductase [Phenylobacterium sp.]HVI32464.1 SDR family NAD(P)-dependent oxidoreductase [Phenylobacterium sp.]
MSEDLRPLAVITGASSGIGYELARLAAEDGHDLIIAADRPEIVEAAQAFRATGVNVEHLQVDLSERDGVDRLVALVAGRPVDVLMANAGHGLGHAFLEQPVEDWMHVVDTNITGTIYLVQKLAPAMVERGRGRILFTGSIAGLMPGTFQAVYNGSKAFIDSFSFALRNELKDTGVTVTCLMPGPTDTDFFERAGLQDTKVGTDKKDDPAMVARVGYRAMMHGEGDVVAGLKNKVQAAMSAVTPQSALAEMHRGMAEPGSGQK